MKANINKTIGCFYIICMINLGIAELIHTIINLFRIALYIKIIKNKISPLFFLSLRFIQNKAFKSYIFKRVLHLEQT